MLYSVLGISMATQHTATDRVKTTVIVQNHVSNIKFQQHDTLLYVTYDLAEKADIDIFVSFDNGVTYRGPLKYVSGDVGKDILPGNDKSIVCNMFTIVGYDNSPSMTINIIATTPFIPKVTPVAELPALVTFNRRIYIDGWELDKYKWQMQKVYMDTWKLHKYEVYQIMRANADEIVLYEKGRRNITPGIISYSLGGAAITCGIVGIGAGIAGEKTGWIVGVPCTLGSMLFTFIGWQLLSKSEDYLINATDMFNSKNNKNTRFDGPELRMYEKGIKNRHLGIVFLSYGGAAITTGIGFLIAGYQEQRNNRWYNNNGYDYYNYYDGWWNESNIIGLSCTLGGIGLAAYGNNLLAKSKIYMANALDLYNNSNNRTSGIEFDFGFTSNGVGLVVRF